MVQASISATSCNYILLGLPLKKILVMLTMFVKITYITIAMLLHVLYQLYIYIVCVYLHVCVFIHLFLYYTCSLVLLPTIGSSAFLRFQLRVKMKRLEADDKVTSCPNTIKIHYTSPDTLI